MSSNHRLDVRFECSGQKLPRVQGFCCNFECSIACPERDERIHAQDPFLQLRLTDKKHTSAITDKKGGKVDKHYHDFHCPWRHSPQQILLLVSVLHLLRHSKCLSSNVFIASIERKLVSGGCTSLVTSHIHANNVHASKDTKNYF